ncbi:hypothetical protein [Reichenbachiella ulvae]|uniref:Uncharacterized protein n=1 Tax=Reichenbachiella ulvae TaxID=2980104 RepID=A0ABT3CSL3_9BACT|nr:hypothetical protein [Reichenbachiella ulvae]MCV9386673.1 hypothetical protein [Reichenbachiella ulvae]
MQFNRLFFAVLVINLGWAPVAVAQVINPPAGRIAVVADGNSPDPDDLGGTAVSLALLQSAGLADRLVHYSHSCDIVKSNRISAEAEKERHEMMALTCIGTARRWGGFEHINFLDVKWELDKAITDLAQAINASSADDPLWIVEAGEPDLIGFALDASLQEKHQFVKVITHHPANDQTGDFYEWEKILTYDIEEVRIPDQNLLLKVDEEHWDWAKNHPDDRIQWIWLMGKMAEIDNIVKFQKGKWDCSDAGMIYYWITGANVNGGEIQSAVYGIKKMLLEFVEK